MTVIKAAGILLVSKQGRILFLKRGAGGDNPGEWCLPGGRLEEGESAVQAAIRETEEETGGFIADASKLTLWTRRVAPRETTGALPTPPPTKPVAPLVQLEAAAQATPTTPIQLPGEEVDFTTFILRDVDEFTPNELKSGEHTAHAWAKPEDAPAPLHPGVRVALARFDMNELGVAEAIARGELTSPQRYGNFSLFNIRITGTGVAYRHRKLGKDKLSKKDAKGKRIDVVSGREIIRDEEYVYRNADDYCTPEFLSRCNGLPVVMEHPDILALDSKEFNKRTIGTVYLPYIMEATREVWAIAKIYDEDAIEVMTEKQLSTSPGVVWRDADENVTTEIDGHKFLLESKPSLIDHIAVCYQGVWDKGGPPIGVETIEARMDSAKENDMTAEELAKFKADLEEKQGKTDTALKTIMSGLEGVTGVLGKFQARFDADDEKAAKDRKDSAKARADSFEFSKKKDDESDDDYKKRHDAEEKGVCDAMIEAGMDSEEATKAAKDRRDSAETSEKEEKEKAAKDAEEEKARKDAVELAVQNKELSERLAALEGRVPSNTPMKDADVAAFGKAQSRFDEVYSALGENCPRPMNGETLLSYRKRALLPLKQHSATWKNAEINVAAADEGIFVPIETQIINEALAMARSDATVPEGKLRAVESHTAAGHRMVTFFGEPRSWMSEFGTGHRLAKIHPHNANGAPTSRGAH